MQATYLNNAIPPSLVHGAELALAQLGVQGDGRAGYFPVVRTTVTQVLEIRTGFRARDCEKRAESLRLQRVECDEILERIEGHLPAGSTRDQHG
jgi:predicted Zn-dependent protease